MSMCVYDRVGVRYGKYNGDGGAAAAVLQVNREREREVEKSTSQIILIIESSQLSACLFASRPSVRSPTHPFLKMFGSTGTPHNNGSSIFNNNIQNEHSRLFGGDRNMATRDIEGNNLTPLSPHLTHLFPQAHSQRSTRSTYGVTLRQLKQTARSVTCLMSKQPSLTPSFLNPPLRTLDHL